jgi:membrane-associated phospholipid phosphatase
MFQTEPIIYLQSHGTPWFTFLMILITNLGSFAFLVTITVIITFGIDFKRGFLLFQLLIWTSLVTEMFKLLVAFPRPDFVDNRVLNLEYGVKNTSPIQGNVHRGIIELPDKQVLKAFRLQEALNFSSFGFPSGHVSLTTALWGGSAAIFDSKKARLFTPFIILIIAFSRIYLGRHFIGDVLGGAIVGLIFLFLFTRFLKSSFQDDFFKKECFDFSLKRRNLLFYLVIFVIPILLTALSLVSDTLAGLYFGTNIAYILIMRKGIPDDTGSPAQRTARVFIALLLFGISSFILDFWFEPVEVINSLQFTLTGFLKAFIPASTVWLSVVICTKFGLYKREKGNLYIDRKSVV